MTSGSPRAEVVVTGMGVVSPAGSGLAAFHTAQLAGRSAVRAISGYDATADVVRIAGEVDLPPELTLSRREQLRSDRCTQLAAAAVGSHRNDEPARASRPFSKDRDGFALGEEAALLVLESAAYARARGARAHAALRGYGRTSDAHHVTMPHPDGEGARQAIVRSLRSAGAEAVDVGAVNAHGTSTTLNDKAEARALRAALGSVEVAVTATKSLIGHALGAAGAIEVVATVQMLTSGLVPPTANLDDLDLDLGLDVVREAPRPLIATLALSNSFAFGGQRRARLRDGVTGGPADSRAA